MIPDPKICAVTQEPLSDVDCTQSNMVSVNRHVTCLSWDLLSFRCSTGLVADGSARKLQGTAGNLGAVRTPVPHGMAL